jgi:hypothetical protein
MMRPSSSVSKEIGRNPLEALSLRCLIAMNEDVVAVLEDPDDPAVSLRIALEKPGRTQGNPPTIGDAGTVLGVPRAEVLLERLRGRPSRIASM